MPRAKKPDPSIPRHKFPTACRAALLDDADHQPYVVEHSGRVFCERCGAEAALIATVLPRIAPPRQHALHEGLYVTRDDVAAHRRVADRFVAALGGGSAVLSSERDTIPWRFFREGLLLALGKIVVRYRGLSRWGEREDYSFEAKRWDNMVRKRDADLPGAPLYLVVQIATTGEAGYVEVDEGNVAYRAHLGARGREDRGDAHDDGQQVHIPWHRFTRID